MLAQHLLGSASSRPGFPFVHVVESTSLPVGLLAWFDAAEGSSLYQDAAATIRVQNSADPVGSWSDRSGHGWTLKQTVAAARPVFVASGPSAHPALQFNGAGQYLAVTGFSASQPLTVAGVWKITGNAGGYWVSDIPGGHFYISTTAGKYQLLGLSGGTFDSSAHLLCDVESGAASSIVVDGTVVASGAVGTSDGLNGMSVMAHGSGASGFVAGYLQELWIFDHALSPSEQARLRQYAAAKWGTP